MLLLFSAMHPYYIKKEDARQYFRQQRIRLGTILGSMGFVIAGLVWQVVPKLTDMYVEFQLDLPVHTKILLNLLPWASVACVGAGAYLALSSPDYTQLEPLLKKYKKGELINAMEFPFTRKYQLLFIFLIAVIIGALVTGIIAPIYSLTATL